MPDVSTRLEAINARILAAAERSGRPCSEISLLAVAKTASKNDLQAAWNAGQRDFAHNRIQYLEQHQQMLPEANWHIIGPVQRNKARIALQTSALIHTIGDLKIATKYNRLAQELELDCQGLVQVNTTPSDGRYGCHLVELPSLLQELTKMQNLNICGLMTLAPFKVKEFELRQVFSTLREEATRWMGEGLLPEAPKLSMGMSQDFEIAIEEGATLVRVGRAIFPPSEN